MSKPNSPPRPASFDGEAIARADREFLESLSDHPLARHPLYGAPPPPRPDCSKCATLDDRTEAQRACFEPALDWMLVNYAFFKGAFIGKGGVLSLVNGKMVTVASMRGFMQPWTIVTEGPKGGLTMTSALNTWMTHSLRAHIDAVQCRPETLRPTFQEDGLILYNSYRPPAHPATGGEIETFERFLARLIPDATERAWFWRWLAHKARRPWIPMVAVILVAEQFGTGRGTLFDILGAMFGEDYVVPCAFGELTGKAPGARFNDRLAKALIATVNEADDDDGHLQAQRRLTYETLKNAVEPSRTRKRFEKKRHDADTQTSMTSTIIGAQHRDVVKLPPDDRRFEVITCGCKMGLADRTHIREWMAKPENIGALYRALLQTPAAPLEVFDPYGEPPRSRGAGR